MTDQETLKPGQKCPTPTKGFGDRVFYETLYRQNPSSVMAQDWCISYGVLPMDEAEKLYKQVLKRKGKTVMSSVSSTSKKSAKSSSAGGGGRRKKSRILADEGMDIKAEGHDGIGTTTL